MTAWIGALKASLTARLMMWLVIGTTVLWCFAVSISVVIAYREFNEAFDRILTEAARRILPLAADDALEHEADDAHAIDRFIEGRKAYFSYQLTDTNGRVILRSHDAPRAAYAEAIKPGFQSVGPFRLYTETDDATGLTITVAETMDERWETVMGATKAMFLPLTGLIPLNILIIWLSVRQSMRPVTKLSADLATRGGQHLTPLDTADVPSELRPMVIAVAQLMERLKSALDAERGFAATSAHELRTPIAGALAQTQRLLADQSNSNDRRRLRDLESTLKRLASLAEKLLQLARVDAGLGMIDRPVDLMPVFDLVVDDFKRRIDDPDRLNVVKVPNAALRAAMDLDAFAIVLRNLIDNAFNHGLTDGEVDVRLEADGTIRVINHGPIVLPEQLATLTHRFTRGDTRSTGSGLGLSIVETIVRQTGATLKLMSPADCRADGFEARLRITAGGELRCF